MARSEEDTREWNRAYAERRRREIGMPALGSPESTANRSKARKATGERHHAWKGEGASYESLHMWVNRYKTRSGQCSECGAERKTQFANISGEYRRDLDDFVELCVPCHRRRDNQARRDNPNAETARSKVERRRVI